MVKRKDNQQSLKEAIEQFFSQSLTLKEGHARHKIQTEWPKIVGEHISSKTIDLWYKDKKLFLSLNSSTLKNELSYRKKELIDKINQHFKSDYINDIVLR